MDRIRLLVVEDSEDDFILAREMLLGVDGQRYEVDWADSAEDALPRMADNQYDCYLIDYKLEARTGIQLLKQAKTLGCVGPMIILTGYSSPALDAQCQELGATDYLVKGSFDATALDRTIRYAIGAHDYQQQLAHSEERYRALVEICPDAIVVHHRGRILFLNRTARELFQVDDGAGRLRLADVGLDEDDLDPPDELPSNVPRTIPWRRGDRALDVTSAPMLYDGKESILALLRPHLR